MPCYEVDIRDLDRVRDAITDFRPHHLYHLAAVSSAAVARRDPRLACEVNVTGTMNVLESAMRLSPPPHFLNVSTAQVYAPSSSQLTEDDRVEPDNAYAASKAMAELLRVPYRNYRAALIITVRPFNHAGPGQSAEFVLASIAKQFAEIEAGARAPILHAGNVDVKRDFTDVCDVVSAYWQLLEHGVHDEVYNVCSGRAWSIRALIQQFEAVSGVRVSIETDSARVRKGEPDELCGSPAKLHAVTGWTPQISMTATICDLLAYWRAEIAHTSGNPTQDSEVTQ